MIKTLILGLGPGFFSHVGYNTTLGYVKPLIVSVGFSVSPVVGSFIGWAMHETGVPGYAQCSLSTSIHWLSDHVVQVHAPSELLRSQATDLRWGSQATDLLWGDRDHGSNRMGEPCQ